MLPFSALPAAQGLYDPQSERDACGLAMVADMHGRRSHGTVDKAITALHNLRHRGAAGAEPNSGDGAGMLMQVPDAFLRAVAGSSCRRRGARHRHRVRARASEDAADAVAAITEEIAAERGAARAGLARRADRPDGLGPTARR